MTPHKKPDEDVAATDAVFEELAEQTDGPAVPNTADPADTSAVPSEDVESPPVGDYVRELKDEFEEHQDDATP